MKKRIAILVMLIAQLFVLGHSAVAHHHHQEDIQTDARSHGHDHHDGDHRQDGESMASFMFSNFFHGQDTGSYINNSSETGISLQAQTAFIVPQDLYVPTPRLLQLAKHQFPPSWEISFDERYLLPDFLRGPPTQVLSA